MKHYHIRIFVIGLSVLALGIFIIVKCFGT